MPTIDLKFKIKGDAYIPQHQFAARGRKHSRPSFGQTEFLTFDAVMEMQEKHLYFVLNHFTLLARPSMFENL